MYKLPGKLTISAFKNSQFPLVCHYFPFRRKFGNHEINKIRRIILNAFKISNSLCDDKKIMLIVLMRNWENVTSLNWDKNRLRYFNVSLFWYKNPFYEIMGYYSLNEIMKKKETEEIDRMKLISHTALYWNNKIRNISNSFRIIIYINLKIRRIRIPIINNFY